MSKSMQFERFMRLAGLLVVIAAISSILAAPPRAHGKAYFAPQNEMITRCDAIAVVNVTDVRETEVKTPGFDYREVAKAEVEQVLKGSLRKEITLHGSESFICAQVRFKPGRHLVFLKSQNGLLTGSNWQFSVRPIRGDRVEWYTKTDGLELSWQPLADVLKGILETISQRALAPAPAPR